MRQFFGAGLIALVFTSCGVDGGNGNSLNSQFPDGVPHTDVELYDTRDAKPDGFCDVFTQLELRNYGYRNIANLTNRLHGICELYVAPNPRSFDLVVGEAGCGSKKYSSKVVDERGRPYLVIIDHRTRLCEDLQPNMLVVKELINGQYVQSYSLQN